MIVKVYLKVGNIVKSNSLISKWVMVKIFRISTKSSDNFNPSTITIIIYKLVFYLNLRKMPKPIEM